MKVVFIGADVREAEQAAMSIRLRWPKVTPLVATTAADGLKMVEQEVPDLVLLHPVFSDMSMAEAIQRLRLLSQVPLLVFSDQGDEMEAVTALQLGADDYVRLPCDLTEVMARVWALLRRSGIRVPLGREGPFLSGQLLVNPATYEVFLNEQQIELTSKEFRLLYLLMRNWGSVVLRQNLEQMLWGKALDGSGLLKKHIQRLRQKLGDNAQEPRWIISVYGVGYRFIGPVPEGPDTIGTALASP